MLFIRTYICVPSYFNHRCNTASNAFWQFNQKNYDCTCFITVALQTGKPCLRKPTTSINPLLFTTFYCWVSRPSQQGAQENVDSAWPKEHNGAAVWNSSTLALINRIPVTCFDALTDSMHRILQHFTAHNRHSYKVHHLGTYWISSYRSLTQLPFRNK